ncbi:acyl-CoA dehydrogenase [Nostocoides sp. Soil756]|jgi:acyl-CoA oxidase|uniref:acyl-CoA dehydrogenase family protein n=1 Tax=Nostocoides sp. Soil756 TaxID=1736399 RepID=UPI0006FA35D8|nr:acyl-CoA dehydrogenase [Tetrasphaera sp. Soil756]KRE62078.1 acyl-CoA oxidase [Tetrasphaera sp. Soil756]
MASPDAVPRTAGPEGAASRTAPPLEADAAALRAFLDGPHAAVRDAVRARLVEQATLLDERVDLSRAELRRRVRDEVVAIGAGGQAGYGFPPQYGGGGDIGASVAAFETLAYGDLSVLVKSGVQYGLFGGAVLQLGTTRHHEAYLPDLVSGRLLGCFAMTETGHGSNVQALGTLARYDADTDEIVVTTPDDASRKDYIGNAADDGEVAVVFAQLEVAGQGHGVHAVLVPLRRDGAVLPGVRIEDCGAKLGLEGVDNGRIWFDEVRVPRANLLDRFAGIGDDGIYHSSIENPHRRFFTMLGTLVQGRVSVGGAALAASKVALEIAVRYALRRRQFEASTPSEEDLLLDYGMHQRRLLPLVARTYALSCAQEEVAGQLHRVFSADAPDDRARRALESRAAGTKALLTWHATATIQECREACGGAGYLAVNRFSALKADTDVFTTFEGDNHVLLQLVAKGLLTDYSSDFEDLDQFGMVRFVTGLAVETVIERTAAHQLLERIRDVLPGGRDGWDQEAGLLDPDYQLAMLRYREEHQLAGVARRLKAGVGVGTAPGVVFSTVQDHVIAAARSHVDRLVLEAFVARVRSQPEGPTRDTLAALCDLYALTTIEADRGWFLEHGRLSAPRSKAITREVSAVLRRLRPVAGELVAAFGIPAEVLGAHDLVG